MRILPKTILSAIDFSAFTDMIYSYSVALCKKYDAKLLLVHVTTELKTLLEHSETALDVEALQAENIRYAQERLEERAKDLPVENEIIIGQGTPADIISRLASEQQADMVITATHGKTGFNRLLLGSVTEKLIKTLHCPLLVLPPQEHVSMPPAAVEIKLNKILVGCDFSSDSKLAFDYGLSLAQEFQAELHLSHVIKPSLYKNERQGIDQLRERLAKKLDGMVPENCRAWCTATSVLLEGEPYIALMEYAKKQGMDMLVLGIRGHTLWEKLLVGSTTDRLIRHAPIPVLAVRQIEG
ncbi:universal stress protein [Desulfosarcina sp.]|uniref:universal stress protein n=1 Tax=Desulfosarcina sp. TaxID=2027861 RepID=UPI0035650CC7